MRKYYFAYHLVNGNPFAFMWVEEDGLPVGGVPDALQPVVEITEQEFTDGTLKDLEAQHPYEPPKELPPPKE